MREFTVNLKCQRCGTDIRFQNELPTWKEDAQRKHDAAVAEEFVHRWAGKPLHEWSKERVPRYVEHAKAWSTTLVLKAPDHRYVDCPACEGRAYLDRVEEVHGGTTEPESVL